MVPVFPALSSDTTPAAAEAQLAAWRAMTPGEKLEQVRALSQAVLRLELEGLRRQHPTFTVEQLHQAAAERRLGPELAARIRSR